MLHQVCFATIQLTATYRTVLLFRTAPKSVPASDLKAAKHYILSGSLLFILAFAIWNVDNIFCDAWTALRARFWSGESWSGLGVLVGAVTQGHAWWHLLTGLGCARMIVGTTCESTSFHALHLYLNALRFSRLDVITKTPGGVRVDSACLGAYPCCTLESWSRNRGQWGSYCKRKDE